MGVTRKQVAEEARRWIGTPHHHHAFRKGVGCDCIGLIRGIGDATKAFEYDASSFRVRQFRGYSRQPNPRVMYAALQEFLTKIDKREAGVGDILWFRLLEPQHLGILIEPGIVVHADLLAGRVIDHSVRFMHIVAAFRYPNLDPAENT